MYVNFIFSAKLLRKGSCLQVIMCYVLCLMYTCQKTRISPFHHTHLNSTIFPHLYISMSQYLQITTSLTHQNSSTLTKGSQTHSHLHTHISMSKHRVSMSPHLHITMSPHQKIPTSLYPPQNRGTS